MLSSQKIEEITNEKEVLQQKLVLLKNDLVSVLLLLQLPVESTGK